MKRRGMKLDSNRRLFISRLGSLTIGFCIFPSLTPLAEAKLAPDLPGSLRRYPAIDSWLQVLEDNRIRVFTGKVELGQGITIVIKQVAAEELNCRLDLVEVGMADTAITPNEGYTAGSGSVKGSAMAVRYAAAAAREKLCQLAAGQSGLSLEELTLEDGIVKDKEGRTVASVSKLLAGRKWETEVRLPVQLKPNQEYRYVGKSIPGSEVGQILQGKPYFINDLQFPGMLHARVLRPPSYSAKLRKEDQDSWKKVLSVDMFLVIDGDFVAVVGKQTHRVMKAAQQLQPLMQWDITEEGTANKDLRAYMLAATTHSEEVVKSEGYEESASRVFRGSFFKPYIMHGSMGPACGIALFSHGQLQVWTHSQGVFPFRAALASLLQMKEEEIRVTSVPGAGCFGHNCSDDAAAEAAIIAKTMPGKYIQVQWSREDEHRWEALGCAMRMDVEAGLSSSGAITFWKSAIWTDSHSVRPNADAGTLLPARYLETPQLLKDRGYLGGGHRNAEPYYRIPHKLIQANFYRGPLRVSSLRSLGAYANIFAIESIIDEMAHHLGMHPIDFRLRHTDDARVVEILQRLKQITKNTSLGEGEGLGYAFSRYKNNDAYCAVAVHLRVDREVARLLKMWAVVDAGEIMNPGGLEKQTEGGMLQAASWTLMEEVLFDKNHIISDDWIRYPIMRMREAPEIQVELIDRPQEPALGGGEVSVPPTPAAITNAIFHAIGKRVYDLPVRLKG